MSKPKKCVCGNDKEPYMLRCYTCIEKIALLLKDNKGAEVNVNKS